MPLTAQSQLVVKVLSGAGVKALDEMPPAEGRADAGKMKNAGVVVEYHRYGRVFHGFLLMSKIIPEAARLVAAEVSFIKQYMA